MKKPFASILLVAAALGSFVGQASAAPLATLGSTYSVYIEGSDSGAPTTITGIFDGLPSSTIRSGLALTLTENETDLGGGRSRITVDLSANGDLYPANGETGILGLGVDGDGLDFNMPVTLEHGIIRFYTGAELLFQSTDLVPTLMPAFPWDGAFPSPGNAFFVDQLGGLGVSRFTFEFEVGPQQQVPEPGSLLLGAIGLIALAGVRRRKGYSGPAA